MIEPLKPAEARSFIRKVLTNGDLIISAHAKKRMRERDVSLEALKATLFNGIHDPAELENGSWRYPCRSSLANVVFAIVSETGAVVVTVIKETKR